MAMAAGLKWNVCMKRADIRGRLARPMAEGRALQRQSAASSHLAPSLLPLRVFFFSSLFTAQATGFLSLHSSLFHNGTRGTLEGWRREHLAL